ncbi:hypothetical protein HBA55_34560 [Pseudomaricurvus alkylphenolicus]|uniref:hypothetical protein n=1 Tax=Pseudomaricurvus alkylphenolicus TaxID=1306991 RepID=UPI0014248684|nr:hypothetical protein [Pseudomaricurvus alkylphenolicus]NIB44754.1 hypothetical protein [Pseudomaricurvus alkylphenolicus]
MINFNLDWKTVAAITVGGVAVFYLIKREAKGAVTAVRDAVVESGDILNPVSPNNLANQGVNAVVDIVDDGINNDSNTLGTVVHEVVENVDGDAINPTSSDNLAYRGAGAITEWFTGDDRPFGVQLYEWFNDEPDMESAVMPTDGSAILTRNHY